MKSKCTVLQRNLSAILIFIDCNRAFVYALLNRKFVPGGEILNFSNPDLKNIITPVKHEVLHQLLTQSAYDEAETKFLTEGFQSGFPIGYEGNRAVQQRAPNLKLEVGSKTELWNKVMKEVKEGRFAGPFKSPPFNHFIQSPIGLVPKDNGRATRLIFHLSYPRLSKDSVEQKSLNGNTPKDKCTVKYLDFDQAILRCIEEGHGCFAGKSDMKSAFRHFAIRIQDWCLLVMKAESPIDGCIYYFVDKCMPFGAAISCSHFQRFSDAVAHIFKFRTGKRAINYLDDFFFAALMKLMCNGQIKSFLAICQEINFPVALDKTYWASTQIVFLGILIDTLRQMIFIPAEKVELAVATIKRFLQSKKCTVRELQKLTGTLNFFGRCIVPARAFTRRLYSKMAGEIPQATSPPTYRQ